MAKEESKQPDAASVGETDRFAQLTPQTLAQAVFDAAGEAAAGAASNDTRKSFIDFQRAFIRLTGIAPTE